MILTKRQADMAVSMGNFLESNSGSAIYSTTIRPTEYPPAPTLKTVTFLRATISGQPIGQLSVTVKKPQTPDEVYYTVDDLYQAYYNVVDP